MTGAPVRRHSAPAGGLPQQERPTRLALESMEPWPPGTGCARLDHQCTRARRVMGSIKDLDSTALYAYTTLISVVICVPAALIVEGPKLGAGIDKALQKEPNFYWALLSVGLLYHLYNQACAPTRCMWPHLPYTQVPYSAAGTDACAMPWASPACAGSPLTRCGCSLHSTRCPASAP